MKDPGPASWRSKGIHSFLGVWKRLADAGVVPEAMESLLEFYGKSRQPSEPIQLSKLKSAAVIRLDEIGDVVLTSPLLRELRRNLPNADITLIVKDAIAPLVQKCPYVNRVLGMKMGGGGGWTELERISSAWKLSRQTLWDLNLDLALLPRFDMDLTGARMLAQLSGARWRVGFADPQDDASKITDAPLTSERFLTNIVHGKGILHEALRPLELLKAIGGTVADDHLEIWTDEIDGRDAAERLKNLNHPIAAIGIAALQAKKCWPGERFVDVARHLAKNHHASIVFIGGPKDRALSETMTKQSDFPITNLVGDLSLRQTAAVLQQCDFYLGNDSGPLHIAAAAGKPIVMINGHAAGGAPAWRYAPERFGPWQVPHRIVRPEKSLPPCTDHCQMDYPHCITQVSVGRVIEAVEELWKTSF